MKIAKISFNIAYRMFCGGNKHVLHTMLEVIITKLFFYDHFDQKRWHASKQAKKMSAPSTTRGNAYAEMEQYWVIMHAKMRGIALYATQHHFLWKVDCTITIILVQSTANAIPITTPLPRREQARTCSTFRQMLCLRSACISFCNIVVVVVAALPARAHTHTHRTWAQFVLILIILALRCIFNTTLVPGRFRSDRRSGHLFLLLLFFCSCVFPYFFCRGAVCVCAHDRADAMQFPSVTNGPLKMPQWQARNFVQRTTTNENDLHTPGCFCGDAARQWGRRAMRIKVALT